MSRAFTVPDDTIRHLRSAAVLMDPPEGYRCTISLCADQSMLCAIAAGEGLTFDATLHIHDDAVSWSCCADIPADTLEDVRRIAPPAVLAWALRVLAAAGWTPEESAP